MRSRATRCPRPIPMAARYIRALVLISQMSKLPVKSSEEQASPQDQKRATDPNLAYIVLVRKG